MPMREYQCGDCKKKFETLRRSNDTDAVECKFCKSKSVVQVLSRFTVAGRGDLRESTMHGCHACSVGSPHSHGGSTESTDDSGSDTGSTGTE